MFYWRCNQPLNTRIRLQICRLVVCHNFLKGRGRQCYTSNDPLLLEHLYFVLLSLDSSQESWQAFLFIWSGSITAARRPSKILICKAKNVVEAKAGGTATQTRKGRMDCIEGRRKGQIDAHLSKERWGKRKNPSG